MGVSRSPLIDTRPSKSGALTWLLVVGCVGLGKYRGSTAPIAINSSSYAVGWDSHHGLPIEVAAAAMLLLLPTIVWVGIVVVVLVGLLLGCIVVVGGRSDTTIVSETATILLLWLGRVLVLV